MVLIIYLLGNLKLFENYLVYRSRESIISNWIALAALPACLFVNYPNEVILETGKFILKQSILLHFLSTALPLNSSFLKAVGPNISLGAIGKLALKTTLV